MAKSSELTTALPKERSWRPCVGNRAAAITVAERTSGTPMTETTKTQMADLPMTNAVQNLLDEGKEDEAKQLAQQLQARWFQRAQAGHLMNLTDLLATSEAIHIHESCRRK